MGIESYERRASIYSRRVEDEGQSIDQDGSHRSHTSNVCRPIRQRESMCRFAVHSQHGSC
jgi:hypothetical protein